MRYRIPEISAMSLLSNAKEEDGQFRISFDIDHISRSGSLKWTMQDDCAMFHQARAVLNERKAIPYSGQKEEVLTDVFVYIDFTGIFDRKPVGKIAELQRKAEWMFRPEGITMFLGKRYANYVAFERSASMSRNSKLCFVREDLYEPLKERMMLGMTIGECQLSKFYAYNGLLFTGGRRIDSGDLLTERRIVVIDNPKSIILSVQTITVEDDGSDAPVREYHRVEKMMDIEVTEFDGEGLVSPELAYRLDPLNYKGHPHHSFQIRLPYIKGVVHEVDFKKLFRELNVPYIVDIWGYYRSIDEVDMILTKSMFKGFGWMMDNGLSWVEYLERCRKYDHAMYISGMDQVEAQNMTELNYQFINTAAITDEEFRPADLPDGWNHTPDWDYRQWLTKATEQAYWNFLGNSNYQRDYFLSMLDDPELDITDRKRYRAEILEKNLLFINEPIYQKELRDKADSILTKYQNANLLAQGDNRYLSDDLMRLLALLAKPVNQSAYNTLISETMSGAVFYAPQPAYAVQDTCILLRNPHIARNEEVIAKSFPAGLIREKYLGHLHYVVMVDSRSLIPERLGGADYDGDMIKTISDPLMNRCVARNYGVNYENEGNLPLLKIPAAEPILADAQDWKARFETVKATFSSRVGQISNAALRRSIIAYDENSTNAEREICRQETETLAILTGLEIDSAKSGVKPDLSAYLGNRKSRKSLFLRFRNISRKDDRKWYEPTKKKQLDGFFESVDWEKVSSNLEKLPYYARLLEEHSQEFGAKIADDELIFTFALDPDWKDKLNSRTLERVRQLIDDYEEAQRRCRYLRKADDKMPRQNDVRRILYSRNQEDEYSVDEIYHSFDTVSPSSIRKMRHALTEGNWMFTPPADRFDALDMFHLPMQSISYWDLFCDFRCGGYRVLADIICDFDDLYRDKGIREHILHKKGDSKDLQFMLLHMENESDYKEEMIRRCLRCIHPLDSRKAIKYQDVVMCAVALGKRQFALEVLPYEVLLLTQDRSNMWPVPESKKKRKWRWPWDAERDW